MSHSSVPASDLELELEAINRGLVEGSLWRFCSDPSSLETEALLEVSVIRQNGRVGFKTFLAAGYAGNMPQTLWRLTRDLDIRKFLALVSVGHFVKAG